VKIEKLLKLVLDGTNNLIDNYILTIYMHFNAVNVDSSILKMSYFLYFWESSRTFFIETNFLANICVSFPAKFGESLAEIK